MTDAILLFLSLDFIEFILNSLLCLIRDYIKMMRISAIEEAGGKAYKIETSKGVEIY